MQKCLARIRINPRQNYSVNTFDIIIRSSNEQKLRSQVFVLHSCAYKILIQQSSWKDPQDLVITRVGCICNQPNATSSSKIRNNSQGVFWETKKKKKTKQHTLMNMNIFRAMDSHCATDHLHEWSASYSTSKLGWFLVTGSVRMCQMSQNWVFWVHCFNENWGIYHSYCISWVSEIFDSWNINGWNFCNLTEIKYFYRREQALIYICVCVHVYGVNRGQLILSNKREQ